MFSLVPALLAPRPDAADYPRDGAFFGFEEGSVSNISHLSDNVFLLRYLLDGTVDRSFIVLKTRATMHEQQPRAFSIGSGGIDLNDR